MKITSFTSAGGKDLKVKLLLAQRRHLRSWFVQCLHEMDVKNLMKKNQYFNLDRTILMRDGFLEIDMVFSGLSVVSPVGFKRKNREVQKEVRSI